MRKSGIKAAALFVAAALMAGMAFSGCGQKKVDYTLDGDEDGSSDSSGGSLIDRLGIPDSYSGEITGIDGATGISKVSVNASEISVPDSDKMSVVGMEPVSYTNEDKKRICETFFDTGKGIYAIDTEHPYRGDLEKQIEYYQGLADAAEDDSTKEMYQGVIDTYNEMLSDAVDEREGAGDYSANSFEGYMGDYEFNIYFYESDMDENSTAGFGISYNGASMLEYRPMDGATEAYNFSTQDGYVSGDMVNMADITEDDASKKALDFLLSCGISDVKVTGVYDVEWQYNDSEYNVVADEYDGYVVKLSREIDGAAPYTGYVWNVSGMESEDVWYGYSEETYEISVDDNGIYAASCNDYYRATGKNEDNVDLITWDEALEALPKAINTWYADGSDYSTIEFNDVELCYYKVTSGESYSYIPVWIFAQCDVYDGVMSKDFPTQLIVMDARTGDFVDIREELQKQGLENAMDEVFSSVIEDGETEEEDTEEAIVEADTETDTEDTEE